MLSPYLWCVMISPPTQNLEEQRLLCLTSLTSPARLNLPDAEDPGLIAIKDI